MSCPELIERYKKPYAIDMDHGYYHETTTKEERNKAKSIGGIVFGTFKENYRSNHYVEQRYCINFDIDQAPAPTSKALEQIKSALGEHD